MDIYPAHMRANRVLITGSRFFNDFEVFEKHLLSLDLLKKRCILIGGGQRGVDSMVRPFCQKHKHFFILADLLDWEWEEFDNLAGPMRNQRMYIFGDPTHVVGFPGPKSRGTKQCLGIAQKLDIPYHIFEVSA